MDSASHENVTAPKPEYQPRRMPYAGAEWVASRLERELSPFIASAEASR